MKRLGVLFLMFCLVGFAVAQNPEGGAPPPSQPRSAGPGAPGGPHGGMMKMRHPGGDDPLAGLMFPPELILRHAEMLNLTAEQKTAIRNEIKTSQPKFTDLQFQLQDQVQALHKQLTADKTDEKTAMAALDQVLDTERQIKRLHVGMIVRIKNMLNKEQVDKLHQMHDQMPMKRRSPEGGGPGGPGMPSDLGGPDDEIE
jgi:Spy/CpxP family protein refolding chaperone